MPVIKQVNFSSGEISPKLHARSDLEFYQSALARCENFIITQQGTVSNRTGTQFIGEIDDSTKRARLIPFSFSNDQTYVLVFEHNKISFISNGGYILSGASRYSIATIYSEAELPDIHFAQDGDILTLTHPGHPPRELRRFSDTNWTITDIDFTNQATQPTSLVYNGNVGTGPISTDSQTYGYYTSLVNVDDGTGESDAIKIASGPVVTSSAELNSTYGHRVTIAFPLAGTLNATSNNFIRLYKTLDGAARFGLIAEIPVGLATGTGSKSIMFDDFNIEPDYKLQPVRDYNPFVLGKSGYPLAVVNYQQRRVFGGCLNAPQTVFASETGIPNSMRSRATPLASDAFDFTISSRELEFIQHLVGTDTLVIFTNNNVWRVVEADDIFSPSTIGVKLQANVGSNNVRPVIVNDNIIFSNSKNSRLHVVNYASNSTSSSRLKTTDLAITASHLFNGYSIDEMAYAVDPDSIIYTIRDDGTLLGLTYDTVMNIAAWHKHTTFAGDKFESVASITEGNTSSVYVIVNRTIGGVTKRYVERFAVRDESSLAEDGEYLDSALSYDGAPLTSFSGLDHLEGRTVTALADGNEVTDLVVSSGSITLPVAASKVTVGLPYTSTLELLPHDPVADTNSRTVSVASPNISLDFYHSRGGWATELDITGTPTGYYEIKSREISHDWGTIPLLNYQAQISLQTNHHRNVVPSLRIEQRSPYMFNLIAVSTTLNYVKS